MNSNDILYFMRPKHVAAMMVYGYATKPTTETAKDIPTDLVSPNQSDIRRINPSTRQPRQKQITTQLWADYIPG